MRASVEEGALSCDGKEIRRTGEVVGCVAVAGVPEIRTR
jgi:hypothetical protein